MIAYLRWAWLLSRSKTTIASRLKNSENTATGTSVVINRQSITSTVFKEYGSSIAVEVVRKGGGDGVRKGGGDGVRKGEGGYEVRKGEGGEVRKGGDDEVRKGGLW